MLEPFPQNPHFHLTYLFTTNRRCALLNIYDIASKAGVSIATVSRVLNGKGNVSEKTKEHVLKIIEEMAFH